MELHQSKDASDKTSELVGQSFQYIVREYYLIIWAFLFKRDYAFRVSFVIEILSESLSLVFRLK